MFHSTEFSIRTFMKNSNLVAGSDSPIGYASKSLGFKAIRGLVTNKENFFLFVRIQ